MTMWFDLPGMECDVEGGAKLLQSGNQPLVLGMLDFDSLLEIFKKMSSTFLKMAGKTR